MRTRASSNVQNVIQYLKSSVDMHTRDLFGITTKPSQELSREKYPTISIIKMTFARKFHITHTCRLCLSIPAAIKITIQPHVQDGGSPAWNLEMKIYKWSGVAIDSDVEETIKTEKHVDFISKHVCNNFIGQLIYHNFRLSFPTTRPVSRS